MKIKEVIAKNVANIFKDGEIVNLGVGIPTLAVKYLPDGVDVIIHSENGAIGCGEPAKGDDVCMDLVDAANVPITLVDTACIVDTPTSFGIVRGGHLDHTVLGAYQVDVEGNMANWLIPGEIASGMGGAMDLVVGTKNVIVATTHTAKNGAQKLLNRCTWPLTARKAVNYIVTELAIIEIKDNRFHVVAIHPRSSKDEILNKTEGTLVFDNNLKEML